MKAIIAYDGSTYADAALYDLPRAGFPRDADVLVVCVADFSTNRQAVSEFDLISAASRRMDAVIARARHHEAEVVEEAEAMTSKVSIVLFYKEADLCESVISPAAVGYFRLNLRRSKVG